MTIKERLQDYIKDIDEDITNTQKQYEKQLEIIDNTKKEDWKQYRLKELANIAGQLDTMKGINEVLKDIVKNYK